jgi:hypothetical protein
MGHSQIGTLPATRKWKDVISMIGSGGNEAQVADGVMVATDKTFSRVRDDAGFREAMHLILQLALAGGRPNPAAELEATGVGISENPSVVELVSGISEEFDKRVDASKGRSDLAEFAQHALVGAVTNFLKENLPSLVEPSRDDVTSAFKQLGKQENFGKFFRDFVGGLTNGLLNSYLSRTLGTHLGEGQRFATTNQVRQFESALQIHCHEASKIVEKFAADWFSKHRSKGRGDISRKEAEGFGWFAFQKMTMELRVRAEKHGN